MNCKEKILFLIYKVGEKAYQEEVLILTETPRYIS